MKVSVVSSSTDRSSVLWIIVGVVCIVAAVALLALASLPLVLPSFVAAYALVLLDRKSVV